MRWLSGLLLAAGFTGHARAGEVDVASADAEELYRCKKYPPGARVRVTLKPQTTLPDLVTWAMGFTCKTFVYGQGLAQRHQAVNVVTPSEMGPREAYLLFLTALDDLQLTVVPKGKTLTIVEQAKAKEAPLPLGGTGSEGMARLIVRPTHLTVEEAAPVLEALRSQFGAVTPLPAAGVILVTDHGATLERMKEVLAEVDRPRRGESVWVLGLKHAEAREVQATLAELKRKVVIDVRSNALLFVGNEAAWAETLALVRALDAPLEGGAGTVHFYRLSHGRAEEIAATLQATITDKDTKVQADRASNSLVVMAPRNGYAALRQVIAGLDRPRRQVYVEATILEVSVTKQRKLGAAFHLPVSAGSGRVAVVGSQHAQIGTTTKEAVQSALVGAAAALFSTSEKTFLGMSIPSFGVLVNALQTDEDVNVLSAPQLLALDGKPAHIEVGENVPVPKTIGTGSTAFPVAATTTIERQNVGLTLRFTAFVNEGGEVQLDLEQSSNELGEPDPNGLGATWQERSLSTSVVVDDQQPIVIGGLMVDRVGVSSSKVPLLGDVPLLGALFRWQHQSKRKRNLMIVLTPYVVNGKGDAQRLLERKLRERDEFERAWSSLHGRELVGHIDGARTRGLVAEIARRAAEVDAETAARERAETERPADVLRIGP